MWWRPPFESQTALAIYYALDDVLFDAAATFVYMPYFALTPELTTDYDERTALTSTRMFFSILGGLVAFTLPLMIINGFRPENANRVLIMGLGFGLLSAIPLLVVFFGTKERPEFMQQDQPSLSQSFQAIRGNRPFVFGLIIFLFTWVAVSILEAILLFFIRYVVIRESQNDLIMATIFVVAMAALPLWEWASKRWNKRNAYIAGIAFWAVVQLTMVTLNPSTSLGTLLFLCVLAGIGISAAHVLPWSMIPDAIEWGEWHTGERHEGIFYSLVMLAQKIATSIAIPLALLVLDFTHYVPNAEVQPPSAVTGIRIVAGPIPATLLCLGILFAYLYPLTRENYAEVTHGLEERRKKQAKEIV
jgi:GPH family glycoside/pentoside/hexuronide:cation symporter